MIVLSKADISALQSGLPPVSDNVLKHLTVSNSWSGLMKDYCLEQVIASGGSKVKILYGNTATGKSHYLHDLRIHATERGFFVVFMDLQKADFHITDPVSLYKAIAQHISMDELAVRLLKLILESLGHNEESYQAFEGTLSEYLCHSEGASPTDAKRYIREAIHKVVNSQDIDFSFSKFLHVFMEAVVEKNDDVIATAASWLRGEKITRQYKVHSLLFETLSKSNARIWLYSLFEIIKLIGYRGVVIMFDQFEAILPKSGATTLYSNQRRNDVYELLRQLIDDMDFFHNCLILLAGNSEIIDNEKYGLQSYHALWMRIQPGFTHNEVFNPYADMIDASQILFEIAKSGELNALQDKISDLCKGTELRQAEKPNIALEFIGDFRQIVQNKMFSIRMDGTNDNE